MGRRAYRDDLVVVTVDEQRRDGEAAVSRMARAAHDSNG